ncbi:MAG: peptidoglycan editing factor PgeF [Gammaproteobacteria bacterium]|nr:peptidoglycan editing factor PgeF [Gammaproteobacteria bacterium]
MIIEPNWPAPRNIRALMTRVPLEVSLPLEPTWLQQVHGSGVIRLPAASDQVADAAVSSVPSAICIVKTADCLPILVTHTLGIEVAAIHAGWRGLLSGVIESTFSNMHSPPEDCIAWIGPAISKAHFEVGPEVREAFLIAHPDFESAFVENQRGHYQADLAWMAAEVLHQSGIKKVYQSSLCTYADSRFYSYRRDQGQTGRMASLIYILP